MRETGDLPLLTGGGLHEGGKLGPEQEKRLHMETGDEKRLWEGIMIHNAHGVPPCRHDKREQKPHWTVATLTGLEHFVKPFRITYQHW